MQVVTFNDNYVHVIPNDMIKLFMQFLIALSFNSISFPFTFPFFVPFFLRREYKKQIEEMLNYYYLVKNY